MNAAGFAPKLPDDWARALKPMALAGAPPKPGAAAARAGAVANVGPEGDEELPIKDGWRPQAGVLDPIPIDPIPFMY